MLLLGNATAVAARPKIRTQSVWLTRNEESLMLDFGQRKERARAALLMQKGASRRTANTQRALRNPPHKRADFLSRKVCVDRVEGGEGGGVSSSAANVSR